MTMITPSYLGETIEYSSLHACRSTLEDPTGIPEMRDALVGVVAGDLCDAGDLNVGHDSLPSFRAAGSRGSVMGLILPEILSKGCARDV